jgi:hypothetical protein
MAEQKEGPLKRNYKHSLCFITNVTAGLYERSSSPNTVSYSVLQTEVTGKINSHGFLRLHSKCFVNKQDIELVLITKLMHNSFIL